MAMALHISRVEITNFRNFGHLVLDPFPARAVIVGENGVGKSNFLHALRLVLDPTLPDSARMLRPEDIWSGAPQIVSGGTVVSVDVELAGFDADAAAKAVLGECIVSANPYRAKLTYRYEALAEVESDTPERSSSARMRTGDYRFSVIGRGDPANEVGRIRRDVALRVLPALRDAESDLHSWRRNPLRDLLDLLPPDVGSLDSAAAALVAAMDGLASDANIGRLETLLADRMSAMFGPRVPISPRLGFGSSDADELTRSVRLFVDAARTRSVTDASLGAANVLYLGLLIEALAGQRDADAFVATILAVEEPEAHLHAALQRRLFSYLFKSEPTLILTTHSPHIAAVAPLDAFVVLRESGSGTVARTSAGLDISEERRTDLERYMNVSRAEILFAPIVILVEGAAETYIVPALARAFGFDLDSFGVLVASVDGVDFEPWIDLLGDDSLDIPHLVITDGDADADTQGRTEAGLRRGAKLLPALGLVEGVRALGDLGELERTAARSALVETLAAAGVFVGDQTLEVDLCGLVPGLVVLAFDELSQSGRARADVAAGVANEVAGNPDPEARAKMLGRIAGLGKGRFAQRLAAHLELADFTFLRPDLGVLPDGGPKPAVRDLGAGSAGYIIAALDRASMIARNRSLIE
jgi:putative ATP-dependent endonuclease of OLD family